MREPDSTKRVEASPATGALFQVGTVVPSPTTLARVRPAKQYRVVRLAGEACCALNLLRKSDEKSYRRLVEAFSRLRAGATVQITSSFTNNFGEFDFFAVMDETTFHMVARGSDCKVLSLATVADFGPELDPDPDASDDPGAHTPFVDELSQRLRKVGGMRHRLVYMANLNDNAFLSLVRGESSRTQQAGIIPRARSERPSLRGFLCVIVLIVWVEYGASAASVCAIIIASSIAAALSQRAVLLIQRTVTDIRRSLHSRSQSNSHLTVRTRRRA